MNTSKHFEIVEIGRGIHAAIVKAGGGGAANSGFVDLGDETLIFDTFNTSQAAEELKAIAEEITGHPVKIVVNSHWHGDHIRGNQVFNEAAIISTTETRRTMERIHPGRIKFQKDNIIKLQEHILTLDIQSTEHSFLTEVESSLRVLELRLPNTTFESKLVLHGTDRYVELISYGGGHTNSDLFMYIPDEKIGFLGDLVSINNHHLMVDGNPQEWLEFINKLKVIELQIIIPGHGPAGNQQCLQETQDYINSLLLLANNNPTQDPKMITIPEKYKNWSASEVFNHNIQYLLRNNNK